MTDIPHHRDTGVESSPVESTRWNRQPRAKNRARNTNTPSSSVLACAPKGTIASPSKSSSSCSCSCFLGRALSLGAVLIILRAGSSAPRLSSIRRQRRIAIRGCSVAVDGSNPIDQNGNRFGSHLPLLTDCLPTAHDLRAPNLKHSRKSSRPQGSFPIQARGLCHSNSIAGWMMTTSLPFPPRPSACGGSRPTSNQSGSAQDSNLPVARGLQKQHAGGPQEPGQRDARAHWEAHRGSP
jgi:hypothetical protein